MMRTYIYILLEKKNKLQMKMAKAANDFGFITCLVIFLVLTGIHYDV